MAALCMRRHVFRLVTSAKSKTSTDSFLLKPKYCQQIYFLTPSSKLTLGQITYKKNKSDNVSDTPFENEEEDDQSPVVNISPDLISAVKNVANSMPGDKVTVQSDLLQKLLSHKKLVKEQKEYPTEDIPSPPNIQEMFSGMKIYKEVDKKKDDLQKWKEQNKTSLSRYQQTSDGKLFSGPSLGIFKRTSMETPKSVEEPSLWNKVDEESLNSLKLPLPSNAFEEVINWTNEGKHWAFPIDNEAGWEEEKKTGFHEHVFLEHLTADFPKKGPIRHFIDLVTTGLSKNPYLSVKQKKEHIDWFRDYFEKKKHVTDEVISSGN